MKKFGPIFSAGLLAGLGVLPGSVATAAPYPAAATTPSAAELMAILNDPAASPADQFGVSVAASGRTAVIGSYGTPNGAQSAVGTAYIYTKSGSGWDTQPAVTLHDPNGSRGDLFSISVAISGKTIVVGAITNQSEGSAYIYVKGKAGWPTTPTVTLQDPAPTESQPYGDSFGKSVAISGGTIVVGALAANSQAGAAYIYSKGPDGWPTAPTVSLPDPRATPGDVFGYWTAISSGTVVVGALGTNSQAGAAYIYSKGPDGWPAAPTVSLPDPGGTPGDSFGFSVAVSGTTVVIGSQADNRMGAEKVYIYTESSAGWPAAPSAVLNDPGAAPADEFGLSVAASKNRVFVGDPGANSYTGKAYVYVMKGGGWPSAPTITINSQNGDGGDFAYSLAAEGTRVFVGAPNGVSGPGATYIYNT